MNITRRRLITGLISFAAAPAIVRASSLMPIKASLVPAFVEYYGGQRFEIYRSEFTLNKEGFLYDWRYVSRIVNIERMNG